MWFKHNIHKVIFVDVQYIWTKTVVPMQVDWVNLFSRNLNGLSTMSLLKIQTFEMGFEVQNYDMHYIVFYSI